MAPDTAADLARGRCSICGAYAATGDGHSHPRPWKILCPEGHPTTASGSRRSCAEGHEVR